MWVDGVDVPLVEEIEAYEVGAGIVATPTATWPCAAPQLELAAAEVAALAPGDPLWVRQVGRHSKSPALFLQTID